MPAAEPNRHRPDLHAPFRPRRTRVVALALALVMTTGVVVFLLVSPPSFGRGDEVAFSLLGLFVVVGLWRQASVRAVPSEKGLVVRNLVLGRDLEWAEIVSVRLGDRPWVQLDLSDGDTLAVMGIQRSDGERSRHEATRLATLVELHSRRPLS